MNLHLIVKFLSQVDTEVSSEAFLLIEPSAEIELNLTRFFRLAFGVTYRFPTAFDVGLSGTPKAHAESIKGVTYTLSLKFGKF